MGELSASTQNQKYYIALNKSLEPKFRGRGPDPDKMNPKCGCQLLQETAKLWHVSRLSDNHSIKLLNFKWYYVERARSGCMCSTLHLIALVNFYTSTGRADKVRHVKLFLICVLTTRATA